MSRDLEVILVMRGQICLTHTYISRCPNAGRYILSHINMCTALEKEVKDLHAGQFLINPQCLVSCL